MVCNTILYCTEGIIVNPPHPFCVQNFLRTPYLLSPFSFMCSIKLPRSLTEIGFFHARSCLPVPCAPAWLVFEPWECGGDRYDPSRYQSSSGSQARVSFLQALKTAITMYGLLVVHVASPQSTPTLKFSPTFFFFAEQAFR